MSGLVDIGIGEIIKTIGSTVTDLVTTDKERLQLGLEDKKLDLQGATEQNEVNKAEAASASLFVAGGRPAIIWVGAIALFCAYVPKSVMLTGIWSYQAIVLVANWNVGTAMPLLPAFPDLGVFDLLAMVSSLLGIGVMRHREKMAGVARDSLDPAPSASGSSSRTPLGQQEGP